MSEDDRKRRKLANAEKMGLSVYGGSDDAAHATHGTPDGPQPPVPPYPVSGLGTIGQLSVEYVVLEPGEAVHPADADLVCTVIPLGSSGDPGKRLAIISRGLTEYARARMAEINAILAGLGNPGMSVEEGEWRARAEVGGSG